MSHPGSQGTSWSHPRGETLRQRTLRAPASRARGGGARCGALLAVVATLLGLGTAGCDKSEADAAEKPAKTVRVEQVGRADIEEILSYPADLKPFAEVRIFSRVPDRILSFPWEDGDEIKEGKRVVVIRTDGMSHGLDQLGAQIDALDVQIDNQKTELERLDKLLSTGAIPQAEYDRLKASYLAAKAQRRALRAGKGQLAASASDGVITAPFDGVIADKLVEEGDIAAPSVPLCRIIDVSKLKVDLRLVERDVPKVDEGQKVMLYLDAYPNRAFEGVVSVVLPYLDPQTRTNRVEVLVDNPKDEKTGERALKPGMYGRAELVVERRPNVLVAPERALLLDNQILDRQKPGEVLRKAFVVSDDGTAKKRIVELGARKGSTWQVLEGLAEGEQLIVRGQHGLKDGQPVQIVEPTK